MSLSPPPPLPADIWYDIFQQLVESSTGKRGDSSIANVALTCRFFAAATRSHFFASIRLSNQAHCEDLLQLFASNENLASYVRHVVLGINNWIAAEQDGHWLFSQPSRALMPYLSSISSFMFRTEINLSLLDAQEFVSQVAIQPLASITQLEISSRSTTRELAILLSYTPRLEHLELRWTRISKLDDPLPIMLPSLPRLSTLRILSSEDPQVIEQLVECLRCSGRFLALRKLNISVVSENGMDGMPSLLLLFRDTALTLEEAAIQLIGEDASSSLVSPFVYSPIELPQLTYLRLDIGSPKSVNCNVHSVDSCINLLNCLRPSVPLYLQPLVSVRRQMVVNIQASLSALDLCLTSPFTLKHLRVVHVIMYCVRHMDDLPDLTDEEARTFIPRIERTGLLKLNVINTTVRDWDPPIGIF